VYRRAILQAVMRGTVRVALGYYAEPFKLTVTLRAMAMADTGDNVEGSS
jgi:hypothetical protein